METKICTGCDLEKSLEEFSNKRGKTAARCKVCHSKYYKEYYENNPDKYAALKERVNKMRPETYQKHGLTQEQFTALLKRCGGICEICEIRPWKHIDHDHKCCPEQFSCGKCVRGLLCAQCNTGLGALGDNTDGLFNALFYLVVAPK